MRISDWSSDVCSSDLVGRRAQGGGVRGGVDRGGERESTDPGRDDQGHLAGGTGHGAETTRRARHSRGLLRSEGHTSELQSLMRISYAVFCLKKKKKTINKTSDRVAT